jgi:sporulation protein YlmC with PRC-barrel domain
VAPEEARGSGVDDRFVGVDHVFPGYTVYDRNGEKIGKVSRVYLNKSERPEYLAVKRDVLALNIELIPFELATVDEGEERIEVATEKDHAADAPNFYEAQPISPEYEAKIRGHYGLSERPGEDAGDTRPRV